MLHRNASRRSDSIVSGSQGRKKERNEDKAGEEGASSVYLNPYGQLEPPTNYLLPGLIWAGPYQMAT